MRNDGRGRGGDIEHVTTAGFQLGRGGSIQPSGYTPTSPKKRLNSRSRQNPTKTDPPGPGGERNPGLQRMAKEGGCGVQTCVPR